MGNNCSGPTYVDPASGHLFHCCPTVLPQGQAPAAPRHTHAAPAGCGARAGGGLGGRRDSGGGGQGGTGRVVLNSAE